MKVLAVVLLCAIAAVQGRSARVPNSRAVASLGENPWVLHLRIAVSTSGLLHTCSGSLISDQWAMTAAICVSDVRYIWVSYGLVNAIQPSLVTETADVRRHADNKVTLINVYWHVRFTARFIWIRYGAVNVINPELVTETSTVRWSPDNTIGLMSINRVVQTTDNIAPIALSSVSVPASETINYCGFSGRDDGVPGEILECGAVTVELSGQDELIAFSDIGFSRNDLGAALVNDNILLAVLRETTEDHRGVFTLVAGYRDWIAEETGIQWDTTESVDALKVKILN